MNYFHWFLGLILMILGVLVKRFPDLIAGYNTLPADKRKNVDIRGLSRWIRNGLIALGLLMILGDFVLKLLGMTSWSTFILILTLATGTIVIAIGAQRYDRN